MSRYRITESVGSRVENVGSFRDLEKHHPSSGREPGRDYETIDGELEEVRRTSDGRILVKKDFILSQDSQGPVYVPSPAAGYIHYLNDPTNAVRIYDRPFGEPGARLLAQSLHMERGTSPPEGARVEYGQRLGQMGDTGSPGSVHAHVEMEPAQFRRYVADITSGAITPDSYPARGNGGQTPNPAPISALADGVLKEGDRGPEVAALQRQLNQQGFRDAQGRVLATDGDFGQSTEQAVQALQRARGLEPDGVVGRDTTAALRPPIQQEPPAPQPAPPPPTTPPPAAPPSAPIATQYGPTALSNLIGSGEGGYNSYNRGRAGDSGGREIDFSQMTLAEIMRRQDLPRNDPERLFAVGKFQIIPGTMEETVNAMGLDRNQRFTPELQERMFADYLVDEKRPAVHAYITGESSGPEGLRRAQTALAQEFASVADPRTGRSFYDGDSAGNSASITAQQAGAALEQMRTQYRANIERGLSPDAAYRGLSGEAQAQTPGGARSDNDGLLNQGDRGAEVSRLQQQLNQLGHRDAQGRALAEDGDFGRSTKEAVQSFQRARGLDADGVVGRDTASALRQAQPQATQVQTPAPASEQPPPVAALLASGAQGVEVRQLQEELNRLGYRDGQGRALAVDGDFGANTRHAVQSFQQAHGLPNDGMVGQRTREALKIAEQSPLLSNPSHPDHALYRQALAGVEKLPANSFRNEEERQNAAASLAFEAKVTGLRQIDHVVLSTNGSGLFAVQGAMGDAGHTRIHVDKAQAAVQPVEQSTVQIRQETPQPTPQLQERDQEQRRALMA